jgi:hypothetical protein
MSLPNSPKGVPSPRKEPANRLDAGKGQGKPLPLRFSFYSVMRPQRVFPLTVHVRDGAAAVLANANSLTIKPSIPGALVEPREQILDATKPQNSVTFQVAPMAKGKLPNANVKVFQHNHLLQDISLGMKSKTHRLTWVLALLTLALPPLVNYVTRDHPLKGTIPRQVKSRGDAPLAANQPKEEAKNGGDKDKDKAKPEEAKPPEAAAGAGAARGGRAQPGRPQAGQGAGAPRLRVPGGRDILITNQPVYEQFGVTPGIYLEYVVKKSVYDAVISDSVPSIRYVIETDPQAVLDNNPSDGLSWFAWGIGQIYELMCNTTSLGTILFATLLGLTTLSWVFHKTRRRNMNRVVTLPAEPRGEGRHASAGRPHEQVVPLADPAD